MEETEGKPQSLAEKLKGLSVKKKTKYLLVLVVLIVILLLYFSSFLGEQTEQTQASSKQEDIEERMEETLARMEGVGEVSVVINFASTAELVPAMSIESEEESATQDGKTEETTKEQKELANIKGDALILKENQPEILGVIVVATGAKDIGVRMNLLTATTTLLGITCDKVEILY